MRFRKKPVIVEAMPFLPESDDWIINLTDWLSRNGASFSLGEDKNGELAELEIRTLEDGGDGRAKHVASPGDYIIRGVHGEFYPCKPDIFELTYEAA